MYIEVVIFSKYINKDVSFQFLFGLLTFNTYQVYLIFFQDHKWIWEILCWTF